MTALATNPYERLGRSRKVTRLVRAVEHALRTEGIDPLTPGIADALAQWTPENWTLVAVAAGIKPPSPITVGLVIDSFRNSEASS